MRASWACSWSPVKNLRTSGRGFGPRNSRKEPWPGSLKSHILFLCFPLSVIHLWGFDSTPPLSLSAIFRLNLCLGEGINVAVGMYAVAVTARKQAPVKLYRETNKPVHSKTRTFHTQTGSLLLPSEIKKAQVRADHQMFVT